MNVFPVIPPPTFLLIAQVNTITLTQKLNDIMSEPPLVENQKMLTRDFPINLRVNIDIFYY